MTAGRKLISFAGVRVNARINFRMVEGAEGQGEARADGHPLRAGRGEQQRHWPSDRSTQTRFNQAQYANTAIQGAFGFRRRCRLGVCLKIAWGPATRNFV